MAKTRTQTVSRSAVNGQFVTDKYRKEHPKTTVKEKVRIKKGK